MADAKIGWREEKAATRARDLRAAEKAHIYEANKFAKGWRYVRINKSTLLLVPCSKDGTPTEEGLKRIENYKQKQKI